MHWSEIYTLWRIDVVIAWEYSIVYLINYSVSDTTFLKDGM